MKRVLEGRRFDTHAPQTIEVAERYSDVGKSDYRWWHEQLYRTGRGHWFLVGEGGPLTRWARRLDDGTSTGGRKLVPITTTDAQRWLEQHDEVGIIELYFGDSLEDA